MSVYLHGLALRADLSANLKAVFTALCDAAGEDDGTKCYPSLAYISYKTGFVRRHVQRLLRTLEAAGYIEPVAFTTGGRGHTTWYRIYIKRVPMKPSWGDVKKRLIEAGELDPDDDIPPQAKPLRKRAKTVKGDKMSPFSENAVKGDILSPFSSVKGDILSPFSAERATFCHPSIPSSLEDSYREEDSYAPISPSKKNDGEHEDAPTLGAEGETRHAAQVRPLSPPPPPPSHEPGYVWSRAIEYLRTRNLGSAALANWIVPLRITEVVNAGREVTVYLQAPSSDHARIVEQRYHGLIANGIGGVFGLPASRVKLIVFKSAPRVSGDTVEVAQA